MPFLKNLYLIGYKIVKFGIFVPERVYMDNTVTPLRQFLKEKRKQARLTQLQLAEKAGVGLRFLREMEQGKQTLRMDKVNEVLMLFGCELGPVPINREKLLNENR